MKMLTSLSFIFCSFPVYSQELPQRYDELVPYVQEAPDQGKSNSCLYVASTGAMELIANKKAGIKNPAPYGTYDLAESFLINAPAVSVKGKYFWEIPLHKFNRGYGIHVSDWPFEAWDGTDPNSDVWDYRNWSDLPKVKLPKIETIPLFVIGDKWSTRVLKEKHITAIKAALWKYKSPVLVNYNDNLYWHVILIVGYDDDVPGRCYQVSATDCKERRGAFYVRDSFGVPVELRDYDWFRIKGNAAFVVKEAN